MDVVERLIAAKADVNSQDNRKVSCLMAAFRRGHVKVVSLLVQYVTQFPPDKDCQRHIKSVANDKVNNQIRYKLWLIFLGEFKCFWLFRRSGILFSSI